MELPPELPQIPSVDQMKKEAEKLGLYTAPFSRITTVALRSLDEYAKAPRLERNEVYLDNVRAQTEELPLAFRMSNTFWTFFSYESGINQLENLGEHALDRVRQADLMLNRLSIPGTSLAGFARSSSKDLKIVQENVEEIRQMRRELEKARDHFSSFLDTIDPNRQWVGGGDFVKVEQILTQKILFLEGLEQVKREYTLQTAPAVAFTQLDIGRLNDPLLLLAGKPESAAELFIQESQKLYIQQAFEKIDLEAILRVRRLLNPATLVDRLGKPGADAVLASYRASTRFNVAYAEFLKSYRDLANSALQSDPSMRLAQVATLRLDKILIDKQLGIVAPSFSKLFAHSQPTAEELMALANLTTPAGIARFITQTGVHLNSSQLEEAAKALDGDTNFQQELKQFLPHYPALMKGVLPEAEVDPKATFQVQQELYRRAALLQNPSELLNGSLADRVPTDETLYAPFLETELLALEQLASSRKHEEFIRKELLLLDVANARPRRYPSPAAVGAALVREARISHLLESVAKSKSEGYVIAQLFQRVPNAGQRAHLLSWIHVEDAPLKLDNVLRLAQEMKETENPQDFIPLFDILALEALRREGRPDHATAWLISTKPPLLATRLIAFSQLLDTQDPLISTLNHELIAHGNRRWRASSKLENMEQRLSGFKRGSLRFTAPHALANLMQKLNLGPLDYLRESVTQNLPTVPTPIVQSALLKGMIATLEEAPVNERPLRAAVQVIRYALDYVKECQAKPPLDQTESIGAVLELELVKVAAACDQVGLTADEKGYVLSVVEQPLVEAQKGVAALAATTQAPSIADHDLPTGSDQAVKLGRIFDELKATEASFHNSFQGLANLAGNTLFKELCVQTPAQRRLLSFVQTTAEEIAPFQKMMTAVAGVKDLPQLYHSDEYRRYLLALGHYINAYEELLPPATELAQALKELNPNSLVGPGEEVAEILARRQDTEDLPTRAITPVQRMPRHEMLLNEIGKLVSGGAPATHAKVKRELTLINNSGKIS